MSFLNLLTKKCHHLSRVGHMVFTALFYYIEHLWCNNNKFFYFSCDIIRSFSAQYLINNLAMTDLDMRRYNQL